MRMHSHMQYAGVPQHLYYIYIFINISLSIYIYICIYMHTHTISVYISLYNTKMTHQRCTGLVGISAPSKYNNKTHPATKLRLKFAVFYIYTKTLVYTHISMCINIDMYTYTSLHIYLYTHRFTCM